MKPTSATRRPSARHLDPGCLTITQVCQRVSMSRSTFYRLWHLGRLPFIEEVQPRIGTRPRFRADLVAQYVANTFNRQTA